jgi:hypothetical protein
MSDPIQRVIDVSQRLTELRQRLDELDQQRSAVKSEIDRCLEQLATLTAGQVMPETDNPPARIVWILRRDPKHAMAPSDVADALGIRSLREVNWLRGLMARMARDGRLKKVGHGRYRAPDPA